MQTGTAALPAYTFTGDEDTGIWKRTANVITLSNAGADNFEFQALAMLFGSTSVLKWCNAATISATASFTTGLRGGNSVPSNGDGADGEFYFRGDGTAAGNTVIYHKQAGAWVALVTT